MKRRNMNNQIFKEYFSYQDPSSLTKELYENNQIKIDKILKHINESLIHSRNSAHNKGVPENKNPNKIIDIVQKNINFNRLNFNFNGLSNSY